MPTIDEIKSELDDASTLKMISSAFTETAAAKVQKIRAQFEKNQQFFEEISFIYHMVRVHSVNDKVLQEMKKKKENGKTLCVAVTSNQRFYGNININIMKKFIEDVQKITTDIMVIGGTGRDFMKTSSYKPKYIERNFAKDYPTTEEVRDFLEYINPYTTVYLYFPKFMSLVRQEVGKIDITQTAETDKKITDEEINILFEPELSKISEFFEFQVRSLLFLRVMLESDLARTAARLLTMSAADERSTETIKVKKLQLRKIMLAIANAKQMETFAAMSGWKK
jgi:F-type H+-transporting ATPase subunit gamma